jgi:hypothetical protein
MGSIALPTRFFRQVLPAWLIGILLLALPATPEVQAAQVPSCLVGDFRLTSFDALVRSALPEAATGSITLVSGESVATQQASGAFENAYRQVTLSMLVADIPITMSFDGWKRGTLRETGPAALSVTSTEFSIDITVSVQGHSETVSLRGPGEMTLEADYECQGDLVISHTMVPSTDGGPPVRIRTESVRIN